MFLSATALEKARDRTRRKQVPSHPHSTRVVETLQQTFERRESECELKLRNSISAKVSPDRKRGEVGIYFWPQGSRLPASRLGEGAEKPVLHPCCLHDMHDTLFDSHLPQPGTGCRPLDVRWSRPLVRISPPGQHPASGSQRSILPRPGPGPCPTVQALCRASHWPAVHAAAVVPVSLARLRSPSRASCPPPGPQSNSLARLAGLFRTCDSDFFRFMFLPEILLSRTSFVFHHLAILFTPSLASVGLHHSVWGNKKEGKALALLDFFVFLVDFVGRHLAHTPRIARPPSGGSLFLDISAQLRDLLVRAPKSIRRRATGRKPEVGVHALVSALVPLHCPLATSLPQPPTRLAGWSAPCP